MHLNEAQVVKASSTRWPGLCWTTIHPAANSVICRHHPNPSWLAGEHWIWTTEGAHHTVHNPNSTTSPRPVPTWDRESVNTKQNLPVA
jgi:hypothetical protein